MLATHQPTNQPTCGPIPGGFFVPQPTRRSQVESANRSTVLPLAAQQRHTLALQHLAPRVLGVGILPKVGGGRGTVGVGGGGWGGKVFMDCGSWKECWKDSFGIAQKDILSSRKMKGSDHLLGVELQCCNCFAYFIASSRFGRTSPPLIKVLYLGIQILNPADGIIVKIGKNCRLLTPNAPAPTPTHPHPPPPTPTHPHPPQPTPTQGES